MTECCIHRCSFLFMLSPVLVFWGILIVGASLGTLSITSSYLEVFPFGEPLWSGSLLILIGSYMLVAHRPAEQILSHSTRAQVWFTFAASVTAIVECLLAVALTIWYMMAISPILNHCSPEFIRGRSTSTCECTLGFINPPSLKRIVYRFKNVSDCEELGEMLSFFRNVLLAMFSVGVVLSGLVTIFAVKKLKSLGVCGKSGVYVVTPEQSEPTPMSTHSQQASPSISHRSVVASSSCNYATSLSVTSQRFHSVHSQPSTANQSPAISGAAVRARMVSTGSSVRAV